MATNAKQVSKGGRQARRPNLASTVGQQSAGDKRMRPKRDRRRQVAKHVVAIGFDIFNTRAILKANNIPAAGEPAQGVGQLKAPWGGLDRPLAWALTSLGRRVQSGQQQLPNFCGNLAAVIPQPAHGRWRNPRPGNVIRLRVEPGVYTVFLDDLDCSSHRVDIVKNVRMFSPRGNCDFIGGRLLQLPNSNDWRPLIEKDVPYTEPKGWSLQPAPIIFGGQLVLYDALPVEILVSIEKDAADPDHDRIVSNIGIVTVLINP